MCVSDPAGNGAPSLRLAAIDVGTNSLRLIVADALPDGSYRVLDDEKAVTRLGRGFARTGRLDPKAMEDSAIAIARMKGIAEGYGARLIRAIGTCAVREASNRDEFCRLVQTRSGLVLQPISADQEARLAFLSAASAFDLSGSGVAVVDVGGGSTEIVLASSGVVEQVYTLPLGAVRLTEEFEGCHLPSDERAYDRMRRSVRRVIKKTLRSVPFVPQYIIGTGGTFTTLAGVSAHRGERAGFGDVLPFQVRGYEMQRSEVKHLLEFMRQTPPRARARIPGLSPDRAEIIIAGAAIVESVLKHLGVNSLRVHDRGIRDGLLLTMIAEAFPRLEQRAPVTLDRTRAVRHFAVACRYEERHCEHVARLALDLFDQLERERPEALGACAGPAARELLKAAAILHDVGYFINYSRHHKHSYHLIVHSDLHGFTHRERQIIANVARYHRRSEPKLARHPSFAALDKVDRQLVRALSGILRIADGLDRTHTQSVEGIRLRVVGREALLYVQAAELPEVDIWGAERKSGLFQRCFGLTPRFQWVGPALDPSEPSPQDAGDTAGLRAGA